MQPLNFFPTNIHICKDKGASHQAAECNTSIPKSFVCRYVSSSVNAAQIHQLPRGLLSSALRFRERLAPLYNTARPCRAQHLCAALLEPLGQVERLDPGSRGLPSSQAMLMMLGSPRRGQTTWWPSSKRSFFLWCVGMGRCF